MDLSIIIVNWNTEKLLLNCIHSIKKTTRNLDYEIYLVDNASEDNSVLATATNFPEIKIIHNSKNIGFAAANNLAIKKCQGRYVLLLNTDTLVTTGAIERMVQFMERKPDAGMVCGQLLNQDCSKQNSIAAFPSLLTLIISESILSLIYPTRFPSKKRRHDAPQKVDSCIGACLIVSKKAIDEVGLMDERYFFFMEETDWAFRMHKAGWKSYFLPDCYIYHLQGQSVGHGLQSRKLFYTSRYAYFRKWYPRSFGVFTTVLFFRLLFNLAANLIMTIMTFGRVSNFYKKLVLNYCLLVWHVKRLKELLG